MGELTSGARSSICAAIASFIVNQATGPLWQDLRQPCDVGATCLSAVEANQTIMRNFEFAWTRRDRDDCLPALTRASR